MAARKLKGRFARIPVDVLAAPISHAAKLVYACLDLADGKKGCFVSMATIAKSIGTPYTSEARGAKGESLSVRTVRRALEELERHGFVEKWRAEGQRNRYRLHGDSADESANIGNDDGQYWHETAANIGNDDGQDLPDTPANSGRCTRSRTRTNTRRAPMPAFLTLPIEDRKAVADGMAKDGLTLVHYDELTSDNPPAPRPETPYEAEANLAGREAERRLSAQKARAAV